MPFFSQNSIRSQRVLELPFIRFKLCNEFSQSIPQFPDNINFPSSRNGPPSIRALKLQVRVVRKDTPYSRNRAV